jgi:hypothetical protein
MAPSSHSLEGFAGDLTAQTPPARMPKLRYRNPLPSDNDFSQEPPTTPESNAPSINSHISFEPTSLTSSSLASISSGASSSNDSKSSSKKKKKGNSVLGFLSVKEPSQVALKQFAEQQRKQNGNPKGTSTPQSKVTSNSNYVGQKLPPTVPKVNSKWDGVPSSVKNRYSTSSGGSSKDNRSSVSSGGSFGSPLKNASWNGSRYSVMTDGTRNPPNSIASASVSNLTIGDDASEIGRSPSTTTLPEMSYYFPNAPVASGALPISTSSADANVEMTIQSPLRLSDAISSDRPSMDDSTSSRPESPASSTTSTDTVVRDTADVIFRKLNDRSNQNGGYPPAAPAPGRSDLEHVPDSHDFLFNPQPVVQRRNTDPGIVYNPPIISPSIPHYAPTRPVQNFSRPMGSRGPPPVQRSLHMSSYRRTPSASALPTLYESSLASTDNLADDEDDACSIAPSTIAPSELSKHWYESPRERLGLGRRLQINDASPWEDQSEAAGKPKKSRLSMFGRTSGRS